MNSRTATSWCGELRTILPAILLLAIQRGSPPEPTVVSDGKEAKIKIGKRLIRFDGEKIVLETSEST